METSRFTAGVWLPIRMVPTPNQRTPPITRLAAIPFMAYNSVELRGFRLACGMANTSAIAGFLLAFFCGSSSSAFSKMGRTLRIGPCTAIVGSSHSSLGESDTLGRWQ